MWQQHVVNNQGTQGIIDKGYDFKFLNLRLVPIERKEKKQYDVQQYLKNDLFRGTIKKGLFRLHFIKIPLSGKVLFQKTAIDVFRGGNVTL
jgi:hypothetical protein